MTKSWSHSVTFATAIVLAMTSFIARGVVAIRIDFSMKVLFVLLTFSQFCIYVVFLHRSVVRLYNEAHGDELDGSEGGAWKRKFAWLMKTAMEEGEKTGDEMHPLLRVVLLGLIFLCAIVMVGYEEMMSLVWLFLPLFWTLVLTYFLAGICWYFWDRRFAKGFLTPVSFFFFVGINAGIAYWLVPFDKAGYPFVIVFAFAIGTQQIFARALRRLRQSDK